MADQDFQCSIVRTIEQILFFLEPRDDPESSMRLLREALRREYSQFFPE